MRAWIFDVDGVLVHLEEHRIVELQIVDKIIQRLAAGDIVALISGRAVRWQKENVIDLIYEELKKINYGLALLNNIYISGEFGGTYILFENGKNVEEIDKSFIIPEEVITEALEIAKPYAPDIIVEQKKTIFTVFSHKIATFAQHADKLTILYNELLKKNHKEEVLEVQRDITALNIKYKKANKEHATKQVMAWIKQKGFFPESYTVFGDSISDLEMGQALQKQLMPFNFVYVGLPEKLPINLPFPLIKTHELFDKGTLEFLENTN